MARINTPSKILAAALTLTLAACTPKPVTTSTPTPPDCNTSEVNFATTIGPLIKTQCQGCHNNGHAADGVNLEGFENIKKQAANGMLVKVIEHQEGVARMPKGAPKLPACDIAAVKAWIAGGMKW